MLPAPPAVSVIIPAFRQRAELTRALESVMRQTFQDFEVHVVDDSGDDALRETVAAFARATYTTQPTLGPAAARNLGLSRAAGRYVISLDHDDEWDAEFLSQAFATAEAFQSDVLWINFRMTGQHERPETLASSLAGRHLLHPVPATPQVLTNKQALHFYVGRQCPLSNSALFFRREALGPGWDPATQIADDWLLMTRLLARSSPRCCIVPEVLWTKHENGDQLSLWGPEMGRRCVADARHAWDKYAAHLPAGGRSLVQRYLADLHYKLAYHCLWAGLRQEAWDNIVCAFKLAGVTSQALSLAAIAVLRKAARCAGIPPRSQWQRR